MDLSSVEFDFEPYVKKVNDAKPKRVVNPLDTKFATVVCIHWLQGLCQKMEKCEFLHKLDKTKMPLCKHGNQCRKKNCLKKHESDEEKEECPFFLQGFCMHGPFCKYRHTKRPPDECPDVVDFEQLMNSNKKRKASAPNQSYKISICKHWLQGNVCPFGDGCIYAHGEEDLKPASFHDQIDDDDVYDPIGTKMDAAPPPLAAAYTASNTTFFILQAPDLASLALSKKRGVWSANMAAARELSVAKEKSEHVIIFFAVNPLYAVYGVAELDPKGVPIPSPPQDMSSLSVDFPVTWLRSFRLSVRTTFQLRLGNGMHMGKLETDGRLDPGVGTELVSMSFRKPEWDWSAELARAQAGGRSFLSAQDLLRVVAELNGGEPMHPLLSKAWVDKTARVAMIGAQTMGNPSFTPRHAFQPGGGGGPGAAPHGAFPRPGAGPGAMAGPGGAGPQAVADYYPGSVPGFVVGCTPDIMDECFTKRVFGLPLQLQGEAMQGIRPGTPLFLQDVTTNLLHGLFQAASPAALNIDAQAFTRNGTLRESMYPVQVRFELVLKAPALQELDPEVMAVFAGRRAGQRIGPLSLPATKRLSNMFAFRAGAWSPSGPPGPGPGPGPGGMMPPGGGHRGGAAPPSHYGPHGAPPRGDRDMGRGDRDMGPKDMYRPPYQFIETVMVGIPQSVDPIHIRKR
jgi:cleavage and polyadenylation specificity factor subunit 4